MAVLARAVSLVAVTDEARAALRGAATVAIAAFPFKIGRESRAPSPLDRVVENAERRLGLGPQLNDLYLLESPTAGRLQISREHCAIDRSDEGFFVVDRSSACGSAVVVSRAGDRPAVLAVKKVGGSSSHRWAEISEGDLLVLGNIDSPYVFRFEITAVLDERGQEALAGR